MQNGPGPNAIYSQTNLSVLAATACIVVFCLMYQESRRFKPYHPEKSARNHLFEFSKAFLLLFIYYGVRAFLSFREFPVEIASHDAVPDEAIDRLRYGYHLFVMVVCTWTNFILRRAILMIEFPTVSSDGPRRFSWLPATYRRGLSEILSRTTEEGILFAGLASTLVLMYPLAMGSTYHALWPSLAYLANLLVSTALFFRLARVYWFASASGLLSGLSMGYGLLQLAYPLIKQIHIISLAYDFILTVAKVFLGIAVVIRAAHLLDHVPSSVDQLRVFGDRLEGLAKTRKLVQVTLGAIMVVIVLWIDLVLINGATSRQGSTLHGTIATAVALGLASFLIIQGLGYVILHRLGFGVDWEWHCDRGLTEIVNCGKPEKHGAKWSVIPVYRADEKYEPTQGVQVIFVHGILSSGPRCWGALPGILLATRKVSLVRLLSFKHTLWSSKRKFGVIEEELSIILRDSSIDFPGETIVFAHSLGGILTMRAMNRLAQEHGQDALERLKHVTFVGSPLEGSRFAPLGWPWSWPAMLKRGSRFVADTLREFVGRFPPPTQIIGEPVAYPTFSFVYGSRDEVAGSHIPLYSVPGTQVPVVGWHTTINTVYRESDSIATAYVRELEPRSRAIHLMRLLAANLIGRRDAGVALLFRTPAEDLEGAVVEEFVEERWGAPLSAFRPRSNEPVDLPLEEVLQGQFRVTAGTEWVSFWHRLSEAFRESRDTRELIRLNWGATHTCYVFCNGLAGFLIVTQDHLRALRGEWEEIA